MSVYDFPGIYHTKYEKYEVDYPNPPVLVLDSLSDLHDVDLCEVFNVGTYNAHMLKDILTRLFENSCGEVVIRRSVTNSNNLDIATRFYNLNKTMFAPQSLTFAFEPEAIWGVKELKIVI